MCLVEDLQLLRISHYCLWLIFVSSIVNNENIHIFSRLLTDSLLCTHCGACFTFKTHFRIDQLHFKQRVHQLPQVFKDHTDPYGSLYRGTHEIKQAFLMSDMFAAH